MRQEAGETEIPEPGLVSSQPGKPRFFRETTQRIAAAISMLLKPLYQTQNRQ